MVRPSAARATAGQDWSPFVLVAGLLLIGLVADDVGLFAAAGQRLARLTRHGSALFIGAAVLIGVVTAVLNLDTSVAFLTPVLVYLARSRGLGESAGARPSLRRASLIGAVAVPVSVVVALSALALTGNI